MQTRANWSHWADVLHRWKLESLAAWLLEAGEPLTLLGAQALYFAQPLLGAGAADLAALLEDREEVCAFASFLDEEAGA